MNIAVFEPASPSDPQEISEAMAFFSREFPGRKVPSFSLFGEIGKQNEHLPYLSSSDQVKARLFQELVAMENQDIIMFTRGGYGTLRWLGMVDFDRLFNELCKKVFVGFSDTTFLASKIVNLGHTFLHGPMLSTLKATDIRSRMSLYEFLLTGRLPSLEGRPLVSGTCQGKLIGGNLTCLCHTVGTPFEPRWEDSICFLEDCGEDIYRIDRMLTHLIECGALKKVSGIATGSFVLKREEASGGKRLNSLIKDRLYDLGRPVITDIPAGHARENMPLLLGRTYKIDGKRGLLLPD